MALIYLDGGHGGNDNGASGNGIKEKDIVLDICKRIKRQLANYEGAKVVMSRETDKYLTLDQRTDDANKLDADVLVSVHCNAHTSSANGFESFRYPSADSGTVAFQNVMHNEIMSAMGSGITDRGKKSANFHMLRESKMKAVLTENLFVSNKGDANRLKDDSFLEKIAQGHTNGLVKFLGLKKKVERPPQEDSDGQKLWKVQVGAFSEKDNAQAMADDLFKLGFRPFIKYE